VTRLCRSAPARDRRDPSRCARRLGALATILVLILPGAAVATPPLEWSLTERGDTMYRPSEDRNVSVRIAPVPDREYTFATNYNYIYEFSEIAAFLAGWQLDDPSSPDHGGMIEAEAGDLGDVIQTDNTLEAIITWCRYAVMFDDTLSYGDNVRKAWEYCWRYPAWEEEGDPGNDYYRNHNCAWGLWATLTYQEAYGDSSHTSYAETCATYMVDHPMSFSASGSYRWINPFVTGWTAGNLYLYGEAIGSVALMDTAAGMGNKVRAWIEADPQTRLVEERWAMSSGTAVWGVCSSAFRAEPQQGPQWVETYGPMVDTFQPWRNAPDDGYDWDNAWNVAYANAHHAMYLLAQDPQYAANFHALTDTLLSYDTDEDGGIPATTQDPVTEDMTWISSYLALMGVHGVATHLEEHDAGVLELTAAAVRPPFHSGDSLVAVCTFSSFGRTALPQVTAYLTIIDPSGAPSQLSWDWAMELGDNSSVETRWPLPQPGLYRLVASTDCPGDENAQNDTLALWIDVLPVVQVEGTLRSTVSSEGIPGRVAAHYLQPGQDPALYDTCWADPSDGTWSLDLPVGPYLLSVSPRLPYPEYEETLHVADPPEVVVVTFTRVADLVVVDDDEGDATETYILDSCDSLSLLARRWNRATEPPPSAMDLLEFPQVPLVWLTGEATSQALESSEQESILAFSEGGGHVILTGQGILEHCGAGPLFTNMFPLSFGGNTLDHILDLEPGDPLGSGYEHVATAGEGSAGNQRSQDVVVLETAPPGVEMVPFISYDGPEHIAAVRLQGAGGRRILFGFGLEGIGLPVQPAGFMPRHVLLSRCLDWLGGTEAFAGEGPPLPCHPVLLVSPNPARDLVTMTYASAGPHAPTRVQIYDCTGRLAAEAVPKGTSPLLRARVDCSRLPAGMYLCTAGAAEPRRLVIAR
jgi:hypothetical protein